MNQKHDLKSKLKQRKIERDTSMFFFIIINCTGVQIIKKNCACIFITSLFKYFGKKTLKTRLMYF